MRLDAHLDAVRATSRYLELLKVAALMERPSGQDLDGGDRRPEPAAGTGCERRAARGLPCVRPRRAPGHGAARADWPARADQEGRGAIARGLHSDARRRRDAVRDRHRDLQDLPAALQVRARLLDPAGTDASAAVRHPRAPGARALPRPARRRGGHERRLERIPAHPRDRRRAVADPVRARLETVGLRRLRRRAPAPREGRRGARPLSRGLPHAGIDAGLVRAKLLLSRSARTCCAGGSTASTVTSTAPTS